MAYSKGILILVKGFFIGIANIIPGVSGGTMALILGIYERLINAIQNINGNTVKVFLSALSFRKTAVNSLFEEFKRVDFYFLCGIGVGAVVAILATSRLMTYLLFDHHDPTYGFFMGLILVSIIVPLKMLRSFSFKEGLSLLIALLLTVGLAMSMGSEQRLQSAKDKHQVKQAAKLDVAVRGESENINNKPEFDHSPLRLVYLFLCGAIAISAMILPGISGSFVLLLMGVYFDILLAITYFDIIMLLIMCLGFAVGLAVFTRILNFVFKRYHDTTIAFLIGLMLGSLYGLWPFKTYEIVGSKRIDLDSIWPQGDQNTLITVLAFALGCAIVTGFLVYENRKKPGEV